MEFIKRKCNKHKTDIWKGIKIKFHHKIQEISYDKTQNNVWNNQMVFFVSSNTNIDNRSNVLHPKNDMNAKQKHADWNKLSLLK